MPAARRTTLEIVLNAVNRTVGPFAVINKSLQRIKAVGVAAFAAIGSAIKRMGTMLVSLAGPMAAIQAIRLGATFEEDLAKIGTLGSEARDNLGLFRTELERIAVLSGTPLDDLTEALFNMISAGVEPNITAIKTLEEANRLAVAGNASLANSVLALTKVMSAYGKGADEARKISEALFATQVIGQTDVDSVAINFGKFTAIGKAVGLSLEELATAFADITKVAANSEEAATSLRGALTVLQKPSSQLQEVMRNLGLTLDNLFDDGRNLGQVFSAIGKESQRLGYPLSKVVGDVRAFVAAATLGQDEGKRFTQALGKFRTATKELDASLELMESTTARTLARMKEFIKVLLTRVAAPWMRELNNGLKVTIADLQEARIRAELFGLEVLKWAKEARPFIDFLKFTITALSVAVRSAFGLGQVLGKIIKLVANTIYNMSEVWRTMGDMSSNATDRIVKQLMAFRDVLRAMLYNVAGVIQRTIFLPFQLLLGIIKAVIKGIIQLGWEITHAFSDAEMPEDLGNLGFLDVASDKLEEWAGNFDSRMGDVGAAYDEFVKVSGSSNEIMVSQWDRVTESVNRLWDAVKEGDAFAELSSTFNTEKDALIEGLVEVNDLRIQFFKSLDDMSAGRLGAGERKEIARLERELGSLIKKLQQGSDASVPLWEKMISGAKDYKEAIRAGFSQQEALNTLILGMKSMDKAPTSGAFEGLVQQTSRIKEAFSEVGRSLDAAFGEAKTEYIKAIWTDMGNLWGRLFTSAPIDKAKEAMDQWAMSVADLRIAVMQTAQGALANFFDQVVAGTASAGDAWKAMLRAMLSALNKFMADRIVLQFLQGLGIDIPTSGGSGKQAADGAVWQGGFKPFREFAGGGIVTSPTLGLVGEGQHNEAIVPLPDGRSIPVQMTGGGQADSFSITIQAMDAASVKSLLLSDAGQRSIVAAFQNARSTRRGFS